MSGSSKVDYGYWVKMVYWSLEEAVALSLGIDPHFVGGFSSTPALLGSVFGLDFAKTTALVQRAIDFGLLSLPLIPADFLDWAVATGFAVPMELTEAIVTGSQYARQAIATLRENRVTPECRGGSEETELCSRKSVNTLLKMVGGMAMAVYGFQPEGGRSTVVSEIQTDLDLKGINLDLDTIRKWLKEAGMLIAAKELRHSKPKSVLSK